MELLHLDAVRRRRARRERVSDAVNVLGALAIALVWIGVGSTVAGWSATAEPKLRVLAASPLAIAACALLGSVVLHARLAWPGDRRRMVDGGTRRPAGLDLSGRRPRDEARLA